MSLLSVNGLAKRFGGVRVLEGITFAVEPGQIYSIIGPNGAGKTTLLNMLTGIYRPDAGAIQFAGTDLTGQPTHRFAAAGLARTFQNLQIFFNMSALDNVMTGRHLRQRCALLPSLLRTPAMARDEARCRADSIALMERVGLGAYIDSASDTLPYGALKRLEIARALATEPRLLLLDEPAAGLNHTEAREIDVVARRLAAEGTAVVLVEHNMHLVMEISDRVLVLDHGEVLAEGTPAEVSRDARVIEAYLGAEGAASAAGGGEARDHGVGVQ
ncbi:MAG: ABC transporter ATP-binding protein [Rubrivivax sp.]|nr:ABC transporter ATP-binding protein [Rubrivivax sp.]